jgi:hypothetical protein
LRKNGTWPTSKIRVSLVVHAVFTCPWFDKTQGYPKTKTAFIPRKDALPGGNGREARPEDKSPVKFIINIYIFDGECKKQPVNFYFSLFYAKAV